MGKYVIARPVVRELVVEKSRFLCTLARVETEGEAQEFVRAMKKKYWDATHNCSAYIVGPDNRVERSNDDGEPSGTAGSPMLEVLRRKDLYNTAAVVTRYFGGIKLGAGGLTRTYGKCVAQAVDEAGLAERVPMGDYSFVWSLDDVGRVLNQLYQRPCSPWGRGIRQPGQNPPGDAPEPEGGSGSLAHGNPQPSGEFGSRENFL